MVSDEVIEEIVVTAEHNGDLLDFRAFMSVLRSVAWNGKKALDNSVLMSPIPKQAGQYPSSTAGWGLLRAFGLIAGAGTIVYDLGELGKGDLPLWKFGTNTAATGALLFGNPYVATAGGLYYGLQLRYAGDQWLLQRYPELRDNPLFGMTLF